MLCEQCEFKVSDAAVFCMQCGHRVATEQQAVPKTLKKLKRLTRTKVTATHSLGRSLPTSERSPISKMKSLEQIAAEQSEASASAIPSESHQSTLMQHTLLSSEEPKSVMVANSPAPDQVVVANESAHSLIPVENCDPKEDGVILRQHLVFEEKKRPSVRSTVSKQPTKRQPAEEPTGSQSDQQSLFDSMAQSWQHHTGAQSNSKSGTDPVGADSKRLQADGSNESHVINQIEAVAVETETSIDTISSLNISDISARLIRPDRRSENSKMKDSSAQVQEVASSSDLSDLLRPPTELMSASDLSGILAPPVASTNQKAHITKDETAAFAQSAQDSQLAPNQQPNGSYSSQGSLLNQVNPHQQLQQTWQANHAVPPTIQYPSPPQHVRVTQPTPCAPSLFQPVPLPPTAPTNAQSRDCPPTDRSQQSAGIHLPETAPIQIDQTLQKSLRPKVSLAGDKVTDLKRNDQQLADDDAARQVPEPEMHVSNQKRAAIQELVRQEVHAAKHHLRRQQVPTKQKPPRRLAKIVARLEALSRNDIRGVQKQLKATAATRHVAAVEVLRDYSSHSNSTVRLICIEQLQRIPSPQSGLALLAMLDDKACEVASEAALALLKLDQAGTFKAVLAYCVHSVSLMPTVRDYLEDQSEEDQHSRVECLRKILKEEITAPEFQAFALQLISRLYDDDANKLFVRYSDHPISELRVAAIEALSRTDNKRNVSIFNKKMRDASLEVQAAAATALDRLHSPKSIRLLISALSSKSAMVRRSAAKTLSGREDPEGIIAVAASKVIQQETDQASVESLLEIVSRGGTEEAVGTLKDLAYGDNDEARYRAILSLRKVKGEKTIRVLMPLLKHADDKTRRLTVDALGRLQAKQAAAKISELLQSDSSEGVRAACARSLGALGDEEAIALLEYCLQDSSSVQIQSVIALGIIGSKDSIPALLAQLRSPAPETRFQACNSLGLIGGLKNTDPLEALLDDKDPMVRRGAEVNLAKLGGRAKDTRWVRATKRRFRQLGQAMVPNSLLSLAPGGNSGIVVVGAVVALAMIGYLGSQISGYVSSPGSSLPVTRIASVSICSSGDFGYASRSNGVIDVWDLKQGILTDRFKPKTKYNVLSNTTGQTALLYSNAKAILFDKDVGFGESSESKVIDIPGIQGMYQPADDGQLWIASDTATGSRLSLIDRNDFTVLKTANMSEKISGIFAINSDQTMAVVPMVKGLKLYTGENLAPASKLLEMSQLVGKNNVGPVKSATFNTSGQLLALTCEKAVVVLELPSGKLVQILFTNELANSEKLVSARFKGSTNELIAYSNQGGAFMATNEFASTHIQPSADTSLMEHHSVTPDGETMIYARPTSKDLMVSDLKLGKILHELKGKQ